MESRSGASATRSVSVLSAEQDVSTTRNQRIATVPQGGYASLDGTILLLPDVMDVFLGFHMTVCFSDDLHLKRALHSIIREHAWHFFAERVQSPP